MTLSRSRPGSFWRRAALGFAAAFAVTATANEITNKDRFVCTAWQAFSCSTESNCEATEAWRLNLPDFVRVDLRARTIGTLPGSEEPRTTEIESVSRNESRLFLNGWQEDRGFTWVINEQTGEGTMAITSDTTVITLFTVCAPTDEIR